MYAQVVQFPTVGVFEDVYFFIFMTLSGAVSHLWTNVFPPQAKSIYPSLLNNYILNWSAL